MSSRSPRYRLCTLGREVARPIDGAWLEPGRYAVDIDGAGLSPGTYLLDLCVGNEHVTRRIVARH